MKRTYKLRGLDCANCAAKMETAINKIQGVENCTINFMTQKLILEAADENFDKIVAAAEKSVKKVDRCCQIVK